MYSPAATRYDSPQFYRRCGRSGLRLPLISLGLWHNFGANDSFETARAIVCRAFDLGITHFDLANNYGPPDGAAETTFSRILHDDLLEWRDELIIPPRRVITCGRGLTVNGVRANISCLRSTNR